MKFQLNTSIVFLATIILSFFSCTEHDTDKDGVIDKVDLCISVKGPKPKGCPIQPKIGRVNLYLETSVSMDGYYRGSTEFKDIVADLAVKINKEIAPINIKYIDDTIRIYHGDASNFSNDIHKVTANGRSSELHSIFKKIASDVKGTDISILVSDCILSFANAEVKLNPSINVDRASTTLKNNIYTTFSDLKKNNQAASIYAYSSKFYGKYYDYRNLGPKLQGTVRPFYVWVIAKNNILPIFDRQFSDIQSFKHEESLHFGVLENSISAYHILPQLGREGDWRLLKANKDKSDTGIEAEDNKDNKPQIFQAVLDLSTLPPYAKTPNYLKQNLVVSSKGCAVEAKISEKGLKGKLTSKKQLAYFQEATHILKVAVKDIMLDETSVTVRLPLKYDSWYKDNWSTMDDTQVKTLGKKTFAFEHLVGGVVDAYNNNGKNFINLKFQINK